MIAKYVKKPVEIEAVQWTGDNRLEIDNFTTGKSYWTHDCVMRFGDTDSNAGIELHISTLEGEMTASIGDYIIRGVDGEYYPCKPDIFAKTYEKVE